MYLLLYGGVVHNSRKAVDTAKKQLPAIGKGGTIAVFGYIQSAVHAIHLQHRAVGRQFYQSAVGGSPYFVCCTFCKGVYGVVRQSVGCSQMVALALFVTYKNAHARTYPQVIAHGLQRKHIVNAGVVGCLAGCHILQLSFFKGIKSFSTVSKPPAALFVAGQTEEVVRRAFTAIQHVTLHVG